MNHTFLVFARGKATDEAADVDPEDAEANGAIPTYSNDNLIVTNSGMPIYTPNFP